MNNKAFRFVLCLVAVMLVLALGTAAFAKPGDTPRVGHSSTLANEGDLYRVNITSEHLRLHTDADVTSSVITSLSNGTTVVFKAEKDGWWKVQVKSTGTVGWLDKKFLAQYYTDNREPGTYTVAVTTKLNVRSEPRTSASVLSTLKDGAKVKIARLNGDWGELDSIGSGKWVAMDYLIN